MNFKKIISVLVVVTMMLTMFTFTSFATTGQTMEVTYENVTHVGQAVALNDIFYAVIKLKGVTSTLQGGGLTLNFNKDVLQAVTTAGVASTTFGLVSNSGIQTTATYADWEALGMASNIAFESVGTTMNNTTGVATYSYSSKITDGSSYYDYPLTATDISNGITLIKLRFKAVAAGNTNLSFVTSDTKVILTLGGANVYPTSAITPLTVLAADQPQTAPLATLFTATAPTSALTDGSIAGTTTAMEYKISGGASYTVATGTSITGLTAGDYLIRYAAKTGYTASPDTTVTVSPYVAPTPKQLAITAAIAAIGALPSPITLTDEAAVVAARGKVTDAKTAGAIDADITNLATLVTAETIIASLKADAAAKAAAITAAINAITALPTTIALTDKAAVVAARAKVTDAKTAGAVDSDITNLLTLTNAETAIATLEAAAAAKAAAITAAHDAIAALPATIALTDATAVSAARAKVADAKSKGAVDSDITNLSVLTSAETAITTLKAAAAAKAAAISAAINAITALPVTITLADETAVTSARALVVSAKTAGAVDSDITNLSTLTAAEATIANIKATLVSATAGSVTANVYPGTANVKIAITMANLANATAFDFGLGYDNSKLTYASVEKGDACTVAPTVDTTTNPSKLGVAGLTTDTGISGTQVVAYIVFNVKATAATGDTA